MTEPLTRDRAIAAAAECAAVAWRAAEGPAAFTWYDALRFRPSILAQYVGANRGAGAMQLYRFCVAGEPGAAPWNRLQPCQRVALEVFRATYLTLLLVVEERQARAALAAIEPVRVPPPAPAEQPPAPLVLLKSRAIDAEVAAAEQQWASDDGRPAKRRGKRA